MHGGSQILTRETGKCLCAIYRCIQFSLFIAKQFDYPTSIKIMTFINKNPSGKMCPRIILTSYPMNYLIHSNNTEKPL